MKKIVLLIGICLLVSCKKEAESTKDVNANFDKYKSEFINNMSKLYPEWAAYQGNHTFDSLLVVPNNENRNRQLEFAKSNLDSLSKFGLNDLNDSNKIDSYLIKNQLESIQFGIQDFKEFEWNPSNYNVSGSFAEILNGKYAPLEERLKSIGNKLNSIEDYYAAAKENIKNPTTEHLQLAIDQNLGGISVFESDLKDAISKSSLSKIEKEQINEKNSKAIVAIMGYVDFLKTMQNTNPSSFRIGEKLYAKKFDLDIQSSYSAEEVFLKAIGYKEELHKKMFDLSDKLWSKYLGNEPKPTDKLVLIRKVIDKISLQHTTPENFQSDIEKQIPELVAFVKEKKLLYIDPSKPLVVRKEPDYMAGVAGASISLPGPYDKNANTYYNVGSIKSWSKEKSESYLREYNDYVLQILNIHEAIPGHYTQLVYSNQAPSLIKSLFGNGAMIEGWAVYTERMMLENGYKNSDEMWLMYYKWNLRTVCNTILDNSVHTKNMSKEDAIKLLTKEAFQQDAEAEGKWKRVTLSQVQLCSYFSGYVEIYDFREQLKKKQGNTFNLKKFHEEFLSFGSAPVKYIKQLMLQ
jgi:uncharacterized protein (DUF885 family)